MYGSCSGELLNSGICTSTGERCSSAALAQAGPPAEVVAGSISESAAIIGSGSIVAAITPPKREREPNNPSAPTPNEVAPPDAVSQGPPIVSQATGAFDGKLNAHGALIAGIIIILGLVAAVVVLVHRGNDHGKEDPLSDFKKPVINEELAKPKNKSSRKSKKK